MFDAHLSDLTELIHKSKSSAISIKVKEPLFKLVIAFFQIITCGKLAKRPRDAAGHKLCVQICVARPIRVMC